MSQDLAVLVLAAGKGTRMKSERAKVLHSLAGIPLVAHCLYTTQSLQPKRTVVVIGHQAETVRSTLDAEFGPETLRYALQTEQKGTAHAVMAARNELPTGESDTYILAGDVPLLSAETLQQMQQRKREQNAAICLLSFVTNDPTGYGRILRDDNEQVIGIREHRDCTEEQRTIRECNAAIYLVDTPFLLNCLDRITTDNQQGEYYLTDIVELAVKDGRSVVGLIVDDPSEVMGVNDRAQLAELERKWVKRRTNELMQSGVSFTFPHTTYLEYHVTIEPNATIEPHCCLRGHTHIAKDAHIGAYSYLCDANVAQGQQLPPRSTLSSGRNEVIP